MVMAEGHLPEKSISRVNADEKLKLDEALCLYDVFVITGSSVCLFSGSGKKQ